MLSGCVILQPNTLFGLKEIILDELSLPKPDDGPTSSLLDGLKRYVGIDYMITYFPQGSFERHILLKHGFH